MSFLMEELIGPWGDVPSNSYCPLAADGSENDTRLLTSGWIWVRIPAFVFENGIKDLGSMSAASPVSVLMDHWRGSTFKRALAPLCGVYWRIIALRCAWGLEKDFVLRGQTPLGPGDNAWFSVVVSRARALIKMLNCQQLYVQFKFLGCISNLIAELQKSASCFLKFFARAGLVLEYRLSVGHCRY